MSTKTIFKIDQETKNIRGKHNDFFKNLDGTPSDSLFRGVIDGDYIISASKYDTDNKKWSIACKSKKINIKHIIQLEGTERDIINKFLKEFQKKNQSKGASISYGNKEYGRFIPNPEYEKNFRYDICWKAASNPCK
tara:strand:- start:28 stop:435 length:408 start_codon:yes stop_codon:yes gene_type:complete